MQYLIDVVIPDDADASKHFNQSLYYATAGSANFSNADCVILKVWYNELAIICAAFFSQSSKAVSNLDVCGDGT